MASLVRMTAEVYLLMDRSAAPPKVGWERLLALHAAAERAARARGLADAHAFLPPQIERTFARRMVRLASVNGLWTADAKKLGCTLGASASGCCCFDAGSAPVAF